MFAWLEKGKKAKRGTHSAEEPMGKPVCLVFAKRNQLPGFRPSTVKHPANHTKWEWSGHLEIATVVQNGPVLIWSKQTALAAPQESIMPDLHQQTNLSNLPCSNKKDRNDLLTVCLLGVPVGTKRGNPIATRPRVRTLEGTRILGTFPNCSVSRRASHRFLRLYIYIYISLYIYIYLSLS